MNFVVRMVCTANIPCGFCIYSTLHIMPRGQVYTLTLPTHHNMAQQIRRITSFILGNVRMQHMDTDREGPLIPRTVCHAAVCDLE